MIKCLSCGYEGEIGTYWPTVSIYSDIRCPQCGSTSNAHNREYSKQLHAKMAEITKEEQNAIRDKATKLSICYDHPLPL